MLRVPGGRRVFAGLLFSSLLMALAILPGAGLTSSAAATDYDICPEVEVYGSPMPTCYLDIEGVPASVVDGAPFSFVVNVEDGAGAVVTEDCASFALITVTDGIEGELLGSVSASFGIATFTNVTLSGVGSHTLYTHASAIECFTEIVNDSQAVDVTSAGTQCPPTQGCTTAPIESDGGSVATITAGPGATITAAYVPFSPAGPFTPCAGQAAHDPDNALVFDVTGSTNPKIVKVVVPGTSAVRVCWNSPIRFKQRDGTLAPADPLGGWTGILPNCLQRHLSLPCVLLTIRQPSAGTSTVWVVAPPGDPKARF